MGARKSPFPKLPFSTVSDVAYWVDAQCAGYDLPKQTYRRGVQECGNDFPIARFNSASDHSTEEIRKYITADSLAYLSLDGMLKAAPGTPHQYCSACFRERYPIPFTRAEELQLGLFEPAS